MSRSTRFPSLPSNLAFYASPPHDCSYLSERDAITLFADPYTPMNNDVYSALADLGFRRSGPYVYRPRCPACSACKSARIPVADFRPDRSQGRAWRRNADLQVTVADAVFRQEHFALYRHYTATRHAGGGMDVDSPKQYKAFLISPWSETRFVEFRVGGQLVAVAVVDYLCQGLSAVYSFFDPKQAQRSLGVYAILWQIEEARRLDLPWVYLGYWIKESEKMAYKDRYRPLEVFTEGRWTRLGDSDCEQAG